MRDGIKHVLPVPVRSSPRIVRVVVYDYPGDVIGSAEARIY